MDVPTAMTPTQLLLIWTLMGLLLIWMLVFALLALYPERKRKTEFDDLNTPTGPFPQLHVIVNSQQAEKQVGMRSLTQDAEVQITSAANR